MNFFDETREQRPRTGINPTTGERLVRTRTDEENNRPSDYWDMTMIGNFRVNRFGNSPRGRLWWAALKGDFKTFKDLIDNNTISDINEYHDGITLFHAVIHSDGADNEPDQEPEKIAAILLQKGAKLDLPAQENNKLFLKPGMTPFQMFDTYLNMPFFYHAGIRASYMYTGEHVWPLVEQRMKEQNPQELNQDEPSQCRIM